MLNRAPDRNQLKISSAKSARAKGVSRNSLDFAAFCQRHPQEFFRYKDLQHANLFGPSLAFRVTRTKGWLAPSLKNGQPKYLPEDVHEIFCRLRAGEVPDEFHACLGRGQSRRTKTNSKPKTQQKPPEETKSSTPPQFMSLRSLTVCKIRHRGQRRWRIIVGKDWSVILKCKPGTRRHFKTAAAAESFLSDAQKRLSEFARGNGAFTDTEFAAFRLALTMLDGDAEQLVEAVRQYKEANQITKSAKSNRQTKTVARHYLMTRHLNGAFRADTLPTVRYEARKFTKDFGDKIINNITRNELQVWVRGLKLSPKGKKNVMGTVKLIFDHAVTLNLRKDNPAVGVELPKLDQPVPGRFTVAQCEKLLVAGVRDKLPFLRPLVVGLFGGTRPGEDRRTGQHDMSLSEERINIPGAAVKTRGFRWVRITPLLKQWLEFVGVKQKGYLIPGRSKDKYETWRQQLARVAGMEKDWPFDGLRHTNASFDYALRGDFKAVAANLGNTPEISRKHYIAPATLEEAKQFLSLTPEHILSVIAREKPKAGKASSKRP